MESEKLLVILKEHCLFKKYKEVLLSMLSDNAVNVFFNEHLKLYYKKSLEDISIYKKICNGGKDYTSLDFQKKEYKNSQIFLLNENTHITIDFSISNRASDLEPINDVKYYTNGTFSFIIENKDKKEIEKLKLSFGQYIIDDYQSVMLIPEFTNSKNEEIGTFIEVFSKNDCITSFRLKRFYLCKDKEYPYERDIYLLDPNFNILSDQDYKDAITYGGLTKDKFDFMMLMHDTDSSDFKNYIKNYDKTFFESIVGESKIKNNNKL